MSKINRKDTFDKVFDTLLNEALSDVESEPNPDLPEEMDFEFSAEHKAKMKRIFDGEKKKIWRKQLYKSVSHIVACLIVLIVISGVTIMSVDALKIRFLNFVFNTNQTNTEITVSEETESGMYETDELLLGYIPTGFNLKTQKISPNMIRLVFNNESDNIVISVYSSNGMMSIDTEDSDYYENFDINDFKALYVENKNGHTLTMYNDSIMCIIKSTISKKEIVEIAQNFRKK